MNYWSKDPSSSLFIATAYSAPCTLVYDGNPSSSTCKVEVVSIWIFEVALSNLYQYRLFMYLRLFIWHYVPSSRELLIS
jgi:hypothetical protein